MKNEESLFTSKWVSSACCTYYLKFCLDMVSLSTKSSKVFEVGKI